MRSCDSSLFIYVFDVFHLVCFSSVVGIMQVAAMRYVPMCTVDIHVVPELPFGCLLSPASYPFVLG